MSANPGDPGDLTPSALEQAGLGPQLLHPLGRSGDSLHYAVRDHAGRRLRLREYAPAGVTVRGEDGLLRPADPAWASVWEQWVRRFVRLGESLREAPPGNGTVDRACLVTTGAVANGFWITAPAGETLAALLAEGYRPPPGTIVEWTCAIAAALDALHKRQLVHHDLAPETVSILGSVVLLTGHAIDNRAFLPLLGTLEGIVRPAYNGMEAYQGTVVQMGPASDIHAASALLYRLMVGEDPAPAPERVRNHELLKLDGLDIYPAGLRRGMEQGLTPWPDQRPRSVAEWLALMELPPVGLGTPPPPPAQPPSGGEHRWAGDPGGDRKPKWLTPLLAVILIIALPTLGFFVGRALLSPGEALNTSEQKQPPPPPRYTIISDPMRFYVQRHSPVRAGPSPEDAAQANGLRRGDTFIGRRVRRTNSDAEWVLIDDGPFRGGFVWTANMQTYELPALVQKWETVQADGTVVGDRRKVTRPVDYREAPQTDARILGRATPEDSDRLHVMGRTASGWFEIYKPGPGAGIAYLPPESFQGIPHIVYLTNNCAYPARFAMQWEGPNGIENGSNKAWNFSAFERSQLLDNHIPIRAVSGQVYYHSTANGRQTIGSSSIYLDGRMRPAAPATMQLVNGAYEISVGCP